MKQFLAGKAITRKVLKLVSYLVIWTICKLYIYLHLIGMQIKSGTYLSLLVNYVERASVSVQSQTAVDHSIHRSHQVISFRHPSQSPDKDDAVIRNLFVEGLLWGGQGREGWHLAINK